MLLLCSTEADWEEKVAPMQLYKTDMNMDEYTEKLAMYSEIVMIIIISVMTINISK